MERRAVMSKVIADMSTIAGSPRWADTGRHQLRQTDVRVSPRATHIIDAVVRDDGVA